MKREAGRSSREGTSKRARFEESATANGPSAGNKIGPGSNSSEFLICVGSYERLLFGLSASFAAVKASTMPELRLTPVFSFPAHLGSIRSLAVMARGSETGSSTTRRVLATGGADETIKLWQLDKRREIGSVEGSHSGTVTCMRYIPSKDLLAVVCTEGIVLYRTKDWVHLRNLRGHQGRTNSIDPHPDGRVLLSVGQDRMLRMWDLVAGKAVTAFKMDEEGEVVRWAQDGQCFAVLSRQTARVYGLDMKVLHEITGVSRTHDAHFLASHRKGSYRLALACEDGRVRVFDLAPEATPNLAGELVGHTKRVKQMHVTTIQGRQLVATASSDGCVQVYDVTHLADAGEVGPIASHDTKGYRLTCLTCSQR